MQPAMLELNNILVAVDTSAGAEAALHLGLFLGEKHNASVRLLHVGESQKACREFESEFATRLEPQQRLHDNIELTCVAGGRAAAVILDVARDLGADMVLMGKHGARTTDRLLNYLGGYDQVIGATAEYVLRTAHTPVLLTSPRFVHGPVDVRRILVAIDFSAYTPAAIRLGRELAALFSAEVEFLHVREGRDDTSAHEVMADVDLAADAFAVERGPADRVILEHIRERNVDLLAIHSHGATSDRRTRVGHVAEKLVQSAPCSVLTIKSFGKSPVHPDQSDRDLADRMLEKVGMA